jgi:hypothetical protein
MKNRLFKKMLACAILAQAATAIADTREFSFGVIAHPFKAAPNDEAVLRKAIDETDADDLAFVVANGIKAGSEPCTDRIYSTRKELLNSAKNGLIVSLASSDWSDCRHPDGKSAAIGRLNRLRELFFSDELSLGDSKIPLVRQSATAKFRSYGENARWEIGGVMFATINLPENNNRYLFEAGRNSEFEDRLVANRNWLHRVFTYAELRKSDAIVFFCDGNPMVPAPRGTVRHDGFAETRQQIMALAGKYSGKVLIIHGRTNLKPGTSTDIVWHSNLGVLATAAPWIKVTVDSSVPTLFTVAGHPVDAKKVQR